MVLQSAELQDKLGEVAHQLRVAAETTGAKAALLDLQSGLPMLRAAWRAFRSKSLGAQLWRLLVLVVLCGAATVGHQLIGGVAAQAVKIGTGILAFIGTAPIFVRAAKAVAAIRKLAKDYRATLDRERAAYKKKLEEQRDRTRTEVREAESRVREAQSHQKELEDQLVALRADRILADFIRERSASNDYRQHLGVIGRARVDFERLSSLLARSRAEREPTRSDDLPRIDRIVLYVDDLDRCNEEQVVKVLQAVHLLLAFELFVVVVAVDSRWLLHSLQQHSKAFHSEPTDLAGIPVEERGHWQSTPLNYLEKIFQTRSH